MTIYDYRKNGYKPHELVLDKSGAMWEIISYPYLNENDETVYIRIRELDEPDTAKTAIASDLVLLRIRPRILMALLKIGKIEAFGYDVLNEKPCITVQLPFDPKKTFGEIKGYAPRHVYCALTGDFLYEVVG